MPEIAKYFDVSTDYLLGVTDDPTPPKKTLSEEELLAAEIFKMNTTKRQQLVSYAEFLKTQGDFSQELSDLMENVADGLSPKPLTSD